MNALAQSTVVPIDNEPRAQIDGGSAFPGNVVAQLSTPLGENVTLLKHGFESRWPRQ